MCSCNISQLQVSITSLTRARESITWSQPDGDAVTSFTIAYEFDIIGCTGIDGFSDIVITNFSEVRISDVMHSYNVTGLEENSAFEFTVMATNSADDNTSPVHQLT